MEPVTIPAAIRAAAALFGDNEAIVDGPVRLTYAELLERVRVAARMFAGQGVRPGDRVALNAPNTYHWVIAALGALYGGAAIVPVNTRFTGVETADLLRRGRARALVVAGDFLGVDRLAGIREAAGAEGLAGLPDLRCVVRIGGGPAEGALCWDEITERARDVPLDGIEAAADAVSPDDVSDILFTSGTTGRSKGVMSAHRQALAVATAWAGCGELTGDDRYLVINPFFHSFGYKAGILACLTTGATIIPQAVFDVGATAALIESERVSVLPGAPTIFQELLRDPPRDTSSLRLAVTGAATVPVTLVERMRAELGFRTVLTAYGLTEAVVVTMCRAGDAAEVVSRTSGRAAAGCEVTIGGGEILVRGPNVMLGYLDDPEGTARAIDADGWLHTGDAGRLDAEGNLMITGRIKDMYICGGFNVYPAEVEQVLEGLPGVREVAVVGVEDERLGEVGKACIVGADLTEERVRAFCAERLANYKRPRVVVFMESLPRNASGKVLKRLLTEPGEKARGEGATMTVRYERRGPVAVVTMNRPEYRNAQNSAMTYALDDAFARAVEDAEVKVIVLAGEGKHFSAGHDIGSPERDADTSFDRRAVVWWDHTTKEGGDRRFARESEVYLGMCRRWREIPKPMIASVQGACIAGGLMLAWVCDLIVASEDAFFADPVVRMGIPGVEYFAHPWVLGPRAAKEVLFTGERFTAAQAREWGMLNRVVPRDELENETLALAGKIAEMPSFGLTLAKKAVNQAEDLMGMRSGMDSVFGLHHFAHAHNAETSDDSLGGHSARSMRDAGAR